jgi:murein DD-endopeptidase MepM/ murein hydrolase activator NlpD
MSSYPLAVNRIRTEHLKFPDRGGKFGPNVRGSKGHYGWDLVASPGTSVFSVGAGTVAFVHTGIPGYGTVVQLKFKHGSTDYWALYAHLSTTWVKKGQIVGQGQVIGNTGRTGNARGEPPHLHFEIAKDPSLKRGRRNQIDPSIVLGPFLNEYSAGEATYRESDFELNLDAYEILNHTA